MHKFYSEYTCSRCGTQERVEQPHDKPEGWINMTISSICASFDLSSILKSITEPNRKDLCPTCVESFDDWFNTDSN